MIASRNEIKTLLEISDITKDSLIDALIPLAQDDLLAYLNNHFKTPVYNQSTRIAFDATNKKITDAESNFVENDFTDGIHVIVEGSKRNDGIYYVSDAVAGYLKIGTGKQVVDETAENMVCVTKIVFPDALKIAIARYIGGLLESANRQGVSSESIGNYSVSYSQGNKDFREQVLGSLKQYKRPRV